MCQPPWSLMRHAFLELRQMMPADLRPVFTDSICNRFGASQSANHAAMSVPSGDIQKRRDLSQQLQKSWMGQRAAAQEREALQSDSHDYPMPMRSVGAASSKPGKNSVTDDQVLDQITGQYRVPAASAWDASAICFYLLRCSFTTATPKTS